MSCWSVPSSHTREMKKSTKLPDPVLTCHGHSLSVLPALPGKPLELPLCVLPGAVSGPVSTGAESVCVESIGDMIQKWFCIPWPSFYIPRAGPFTPHDSCVLTLAAQHVCVGKCLVSLPRIAFSCLSSIPGTWYSCKELRTAIFRNAVHKGRGCTRWVLRALHALKSHDSTFGCFLLNLVSWYFSFLYSLLLIATFLRSMTT